LSELIKQTEVIIEETQRESIINRPYNLAGSIKEVTKDRFNISKNGIYYSKSKVVPALLKLFMEALDNPIDVAIKGGCNKIDIVVDNKSISISDNGYGVNTNKDKIDNEYIVYKAFCKYNVSSNYQDNKGKGQKGVNGIGIKLCTTLSTLFSVETEDSNGRVRLIATENNLNHEINVLKRTRKTGTTVYFEPDFSIFDVDNINKNHIERMYEYTLMQSLTYPNIKFKFNGVRVQIKPRQFMKLLDENIVLAEEEDYFFGIVPNTSGEFKQLSYINGLEISEGGTHIDVILDTIVRNMRTKISKKYKNIKPGDIKSKLTLVLIGKNMKNIDWEGQVKNKIASSIPNIKEYFSNIDLEKFSNKVYNNKEILNNILDYFKIQEEFKKQKELKSLDKKPTKKPKDDKFLSPVGKWTNILLCEGDSARNSLSSILGRHEMGYYAMFGVPPNGYDMKIEDIIKSVKLKAIQKIVGLQYSKTEQSNLNFDNIILATDADLPGFFIRGQLIGLFYRFGKNLFNENRIKILRTPLFVCTKQEKIVNWFYSFEAQKEFENQNKGKGYSYEYKKGLSGWDKDELQTVIDKDGFDNMLETLSLGDIKDELDETHNLIHNWLSSDKSNSRKEMLNNFNFNILSM